MGSPGSASFMFAKEGVLHFEDPFGGSQEKVQQSEPKVTVDQVFDVMLEAGDEVKSFELVGDQIEVIVEPNALASAKQTLANLGLVKCTKAEIV